MNLKLEFLDKQISPWSGLSLMKQLLDKTKIESFLTTLPLPVQGSNRAYSPIQLIVQFWISIWCGANRFEHLEVTRHDAMIGELFGFKKLAGHRAFQRYFAKFSQADNINIFTSIYQWFFSQLQFDNFTLDLDSTIFCRYGNQEGAAIGYNPSKPGRKSHHPLLAFVDDCRMLANFWLRPGNSHSSNNFISFLMATLQNLKGKRIGLLRADSGFFDQTILNHLESQPTPIQYIIAARFYPGVKLSFIKHKAWLAVDTGIEIGEVMYQAADWSTSRRIVIVRQKIEDRPRATGKKIKKLNGKQLEIFQEDDQIKGYRYSCMVTNLTLPAKEIWTLYRGRADAENRIKELKEDFGVAGFNTANFYQTEAALNCVMMAYNLMSLFRQATIGTKVQHTLKTLRYKVFSVAGYMTKDGNSHILKLAMAMKRREWFTGLWQNSKNFSWPNYNS